MYSAVMVVVITIGGERSRVRAKDEQYDLHERIFQPIIDNPTLTDKPKIFVVEASRGEREFRGNAINLLRANTMAGSFSGKPTEIIKLFSNEEGYKTYRTERGSYLIQTLSNVLERYAHEDMSADVREMFYIVSHEVESETG